MIRVRMTSKGWLRAVAVKPEREPQKKWTDAGAQWFVVKFEFGLEESAERRTLQVSFVKSSKELK